MANTLLMVLVALAAVTILLLLFLLKRQGDSLKAARDYSPVLARFDLLDQLVQQSERSIREEFSRLRQEMTRQNQALQVDSATSIKSLSESLLRQLITLGTANDQRFDLLRNSMAESGTRLQAKIGEELERLRNGLNQATQQAREETSAALKGVSESLGKNVSELTISQKAQLDEIRVTVENRLTAMSADNEKRLEQMRQTVDEKLQGTLEARLGESFKLVSERLEQVHSGLGEMRNLASGVGDLKRVLTNVKTRGTWGEVQLGTLLEQILSPDQFEKNVSTTGTQERVDFAIKLPGREAGKICWLPVDAKFPVEDYQRLMDAAELGDPAAVEVASRDLEATLKLCARTINEKYLLPPETTDFGILFLATEGLYAEALRRAGLAEALQREYRVILTGPNTFAAILNSLQMGFRTLVIQKRSSEVWEALGAVKTEFAKYTGVLAKVKKKLEEASNMVDRAETRTRVLQRHLRDVEASPTGSVEALDLPPIDFGVGEESANGGPAEIPSPQTTLDFVKEVS
jgi:DNA recombination protein RmuC